MYLIKKLEQKSEPAKINSVPTLRHRNIIVTAVQYTVHLFYRTVCILYSV